VKLRRKSPYEDYLDPGRLRRCAECRVAPVADLYMLKPELWARIAKLRQFLCLPCAEKRLGRTLTADDFTDVPCNAARLRRLDAVPI
jgi:hypothetical protein